MRAFWVDIVAVAFFVAEWLAYGLTLEHSAYGRDSLSARMNRYREVWIRNMLDREARMVDMQIMASLQNGTAFFASTSLMAIGGGLALLRATSDALAVLRELPVDLTPSPALWELKCVGLILIFICRPPPSATLRKPRRMSCARRACSRQPAGTSTAVSARSSLRSAISAGSSARGCCWRRRRSSWS